MENEREKTPARRLVDYLDARRPIVFIRDFDYSSVDRIVREAIEEQNQSGEQWRLYEHSENGDEIVWKTDASGKWTELVLFRDSPLEAVLERFDDPKYGDPGEEESACRWLLVLKGTEWRAGGDSCGSRSSRSVSGRLQSIALRLKKDDENQEKRHKDDPRYGVHIVVADGEANIPPELEKWISIVDVPPPNDKRLGELVQAFKDTNNATVRDLDLLKKDLKGLSEFEVFRLLNLAYVVGGGVVSKKVRDVILEEKRQAVQKSGLLEMQDLRDVPELGGLENLKNYFADVEKVIKNPDSADEHGVNMPAGVMIVGMPGCGKSLSAKCLAKQLELPLLRLDVGRLMGKYVGESESNFARAVRVAEKAAPCVLWIDEIEKAFAGIGGSGGGAEVTTRMFGWFLTWMQEKKDRGWSGNCVYVVATANDISNLPPEFLRRGRFDEIFAVDFPNRKELEAVFDISLKKRNRRCRTENIAARQLVKKLDVKKKFTPAEVESIVNEAMKNLFLKTLKEGRRVANDEKEMQLEERDVLSVAEDFRTGYQSQSKKLDDMAAKLKALNARPASIADS